MNNKEVLLSICIPTYNGMRSSLVRVMNTLLTASKTCPDFEIVVSDNCSNDETQSYLSQFVTLPFFRYYRNETNLGYKKNMFLLTDSYAQGEYCWLIGDDDIIAPDAIGYITNVLKNGNLDYLSVAHCFLQKGDVLLPAIKKSEIQPHFCSYGRAIDSNSATGNTFACFIGASIFRTQMFRDIDKSEFSNSFVEFYNIFPNAYLLAKAFSKSKCGYINHPIIYPVYRSKEWATEETMYRLLSISYFEMYNHLLSQGVCKSDLRNTYERLLKENMFVGIKRLLKAKPVNKSFFSCLYEILITPRLFCKTISDSYVILRNKFRNEYIKQLFEGNALKLLAITIVITNIWIDIVKL